MNKYKLYPTTINLEVPLKGTSDPDDTLGIDINLNLYKDKYIDPKFVKEALDEVFESIYNVYK